VDYVNVFLMGIILNSSCIQEKRKDKFGLSLPVIIPTTVTPLYLDETFYENDFDGTFPRDWTILRVDAINSTDDSKHVMPLSVGEKIDAFFRFRARPAIIKKDLIYNEKKTVRGDCMRSHFLM
jgi:hypothetical protein